jgi:hypothetical protein
MTIVAAQSITGFFQEAVEDAIKTRRVDTKDAVRSYLVGLLADAHAGETLARPLAFLLDEAVKQPDPALRFEKLRALGDGVLYGCGFFGEHFAARGVDQKYLFAIGTRAYGAAGSMLKTHEEEAELDLFGELAAKFGVYVDVLADVADSTIANATGTPKSLLKVYERWLKTGSDRLASALSSHGLVPMRGPKGLQ